MKTMYKASVSRYQGQALGLAASLLAVGGVLGSANIASAATFSFSFQNVDNVVPVNGVQVPLGALTTGTIELPDEALTTDGIYSATALTITSGPSQMVLTFPINVFDPSFTISSNFFDVASGAIRANNSNFTASSPTIGFALSNPLVGTFLEDSTFTGPSTSDNANSTLVYTSSAPAAVPEPATVLGLLTVGGLGLLSRKRGA